MSTRSSKTKLVVLISGRGSNMHSIIEAIHAQQLDAEIVAVISNRPNAPGLELAKQAGIDALAIDHKNFDSRESFDQALQQLIDSYSADFVILAGFMRILTDSFVEHFSGKLINIHPSLLPKYKGLNTHQRAIDAGDKQHGASVHFVTAELDAGPVIMQAIVPIQLGDTAEVLAARVLEQEHILYPAAIQKLIEQRKQL